MARMTDQERAVLVRRFMAECAHMPVAQLRALKADLNNRMVANRYPLPDLDANYQVLAQLNQRISALEAEAPTPEEQHRQSVERLARFGGVAAAIAERYIKEKGDPLADVMRKERKAALNPEPADAVPQQQKEKPDLRPYR